MNLRAALELLDWIQATRPDNLDTPPQCDRATAYRQLRALDDLLGVKVERRTNGLAVLNWGRLRPE
jgi:hypothetical protein